MKKFTRSVSLLLVVFMLVLMLPQQIHAADSSDLTFRLNADGESYSVTDCKEFASGALTIPATYNGYPVTKIDNLAFLSCDSLTSITIPDGVISIGDSAFDTCQSLTSITIPDSVISIGDYAFINCFSLTSIIIPDGVTCIDVGVFSWCTSLTSITIPDSVTSIGDYAFSGCFGMKSIRIPASVASIGNSAFPYYDSDLEQDYSLTDVYYGGTQEQWKAITIGSDNQGLTNATLHCQPEEVVPECLVYEIANGEVTITGCDQSATGELVIPSTIEGYPVTGIGSYAFTHCFGLMSITIPDGVTSIGSYAFDNCQSLEWINIPDSVTSIGPYAFNYCFNLTSITIPDSMTSIGDYAFFCCQGLSSITIPDSVTSIGDAAFGECYNLTSITIPASVTSIGNSVFPDYDEVGIEYHLTDIYYGGTQEQWKAITIGSDNQGLTNATLHCQPEEVVPECLIYEIANGEVTITGCDQSATGELVIPSTIEGYPVTKIGNSAFELCNLDSIVIPNSVTSIGSSAFSDCLGLTTVTIGDSVTAIPDYAFYWCFALKSITLPASVISIGNSAFPDYDSDAEWYYSLTDIYYDGTQEQWKAITIGSDNQGLANATLHCQRKEVAVGYLDFVIENGTATITGCDESATGELVIPSTIEGYPVTKIGNSAFSDCLGLTSITIPSSVTRIGSSAFSNCTSLTSIMIPNRITTVGAAAFAGCSSLESLTIPTVYTSVNKDFGYDYDGDWYLSHSCTYKYPFGYFFGTESYEGGVATSQHYNYTTRDYSEEKTYSNTGVTTYYIPASLKSVTCGDVIDYAFENCAGLTSVYVRNFASNGKDAFRGCKSLESLNIPDVDFTEYWSYDEYWLKDPYSMTYYYPLGYLFGAGDSTEDYIATTQTYNYRHYSYNNGAEEFGTNCATYMIPKSLKSITVRGGKITNYAFENCSGFTSVTLENGVTGIGASAFSGCGGLTSITIPESVTNIGDFAFFGCSALTGIWVSESNAAYSSDEDGVLFNQDKTILIQVPAKGVAEAYSIPEGVTGIGCGAFGNCTDLTGITIPKSVTSIGESAFSGANALQTVYYGGTQDPWKVIAIASGNEPLKNATWHTENEYPFTYTISGGAVTIVDCDTTLTGELVIPEKIEGYPVAVIGGSAFADCSGLTSITIPSRVYSIGFYAFSNCSSLKNITIAGKVVGIGDYAFHNCSSLETIQLPNTVKTIGTGAFNNCTKLTNIRLPENLTAISVKTFAGCSALTSISIPDSVNAIGNSAFYGCTGLTGISIGAGVDDIGDSAFALCTSLERVVIPDNVSSIGVNAFSGCTGLTRTAIGNGVTTIGNFAFSQTALTDITIPSSVTKMGKSVFSGCADLADIIISDGVKHIDTGVFAECTGLVNITIPNSVTQIGQDAFRDCSSLEKVYYGGTRQQWSSISVGAGNTILTDADIFYSIVSMLEYKIVDGQVTITGLPTDAAGRLTIPATIDGYPVTAIGNRAFYNCRGLTVVVIPDSVKSIGNAAFGWCLGLTEITVPDSVESIGYSAFCNCFKLTSFRVPAHVTAVSNSMLEGCSGLTEVILPDGLQSIGYYAFSGCESLETVAIPATVTDIQNSAFAKCYSLRSVVIPDGITDIDYSVFEACQSLEMVTIPGSVTTINMYAFDGCTSLENVCFKGSHSQWKNLSVGTRNDALMTANVYCAPLELQEDVLLVTADGETDTVLVTVGQVLDLNGHTLTVDSLVSFGQIIDSVGGGGLIVTDLEVTDNDWLPIYDGVAKCYRFYAYDMCSLGSKAQTGGAIFNFTLDFTDAAAYSTLLNAEDLQVSVTLSLGDKSKSFAFSKELVARYAKLQMTYPGMQSVMKLNVTGMDHLEEGTVLTVTPSISAAKGKLNILGDGMEYIA